MGKLLVTVPATIRAAFLAGLAVGYWTDRADLSSDFMLDRQFTPSQDRAAADKVRVFFYHGAFPSTGHILKNGAAYEFAPAFPI